MDSTSASRSSWSPPTGPGLIQEYLDRYGPRVWATTFAVRDLGATEAHFASRGIELLPGDAPGSTMVPPELQPPRRVPVSLSNRYRLDVPSGGHSACAPSPFCQRSSCPGPSNRPRARREELEEAEATNLIEVAEIVPEQGVVASCRTAVV